MLGSVDAKKVPGHSIKGRWEGECFPSPFFPACWSTSHDSTAENKPYTVCDNNAKSLNMRDFSAQDGGVSSFAVHVNFHL